VTPQINKGSFCSLFTILLHFSILRLVLSFTIMSSTFCNDVHMYIHIYIFSIVYIKTVYLLRAYQISYINIMMPHTTYFYVFPSIIYGKHFFEVI
jgi:hypothetical protein